ncbi:MAG: hypothetical protein ABW090_08345 [Sedimenticola sp.]
MAQPLIKHRNNAYRPLARSLWAPLRTPGSVLASLDIDGYTGATPP